MSVRFYHPQLSSLCQQYRCEDNCTTWKSKGRGYVFLESRQALLLPWNKVQVNLIGPWKVSMNGMEITFQALTIFDTVTNLLEIIWIKNKTSENIVQQFSNCWLACYIWPFRVVHDNSSGFIG